MTVRRGRRLAAAVPIALAIAAAPAVAQKQRVSPSAGGFSASPVAAGGRLYLSSEDGDVFVVRAGRRFELLATNRMGEVVMATPAITGNLIVVRTRLQLIGIRTPGAAGS